MRKPFVAGNWKLNGTRATARALASGVLRGVSGIDNADVVICPAYIHLYEMSEMLQGSALAVGGQSCSLETDGAFTGEVSASMIADSGCTFCIVGHSERRQLYSDTNESVARRFAAVQTAGMTPILCVGETLSERESGQMHDVMGTQLDVVTQLLGVEALANAVLAYEPVWAIGTGKTASPDQAQEVHVWLREQVALQDAGIAESLRIVYGGSVKPANAAELFGQADIDGGLIGGAALSAEDFTSICRSV